MSSDKEKAATDWANKRCPEQGPEFIVWCMCRDDFLAGHNHGEAEANNNWAEWWRRYKKALALGATLEVSKVASVMDEMTIGVRAKEVLGE